VQGRFGEIAAAEFRLDVQDAVAAAMIADAVLAVQHAVTAGARSGVVDGRVTAARMTPVLAMADHSGAADSVHAGGIRPITATQPTTTVDDRRAATERVEPESPRLDHSTAAGVRPVVVDMDSAARRRGPARAIPDHATAADSAALVVSRRTAAAGASNWGCTPDVVVTTQLGLTVVDRGTAAERVPAEISAVQPSVAADVFQTVVHLAVAATCAVTVRLRLDTVARTAAHVGPEVVHQSATAAGVNWP